MANRKYTTNNIIDTDAGQSINHWFDNRKDTYSSESSKHSSRKKLWRQVQRNARADAIESKAKQIHNMYRQRYAGELNQRLEAQLQQIVKDHNLNYDDVKAATTTEQSIWNPEGLHRNDKTTTHTELPQKYNPYHSPSTDGTIS